MQSQRIAKACCQLGLDNLPERSAKILQESRRQFIAHLTELQAYVPSVNIRETCAALDKLWRQYQYLTTGKPVRDRAQRMASVNEEVLRLAHLLITQL
jgi:hypothetical protein